MLWAEFIVCTLCIVYSGTKLSRYGDIIAEKTGLGRAWIGVVLMATVTSLPELVTGISSVTYAQAPDIAVGDVLGSCVFNMLILAILDLTQKPVPISTKAHHGQVLSAGFGILLLSIVSLSLFFGNTLLPLGWVGLSSLVCMIIYLIGMKLVYAYEKKQFLSLLKEKKKGSKYADISLHDAVTRYGLNAAMVVGAATFLPSIGAGIAEQTGLGQTFVGNILIAFSTSLPEVVVSITAVRMDAIDLAIGNLFGSNIFNMFILAIDDLFFTAGAILSFVDETHVISAICAIAMSTVAIIGLTYRAEKKKLFLAWDSIGLVIIYVVNLMLLYMKR